MPARVRSNDNRPTLDDAPDGDYTADYTADYSADGDYPADYSADYSADGHHCTATRGPTAYRDYPAEPATGPDIV